jgi:hypothetical protein
VIASSNLLGKKKNADIGAKGTFGGLICAFLLQ